MVLPGYKEFLRKKYENISRDDFINEINNYIDDFGIKSIGDIMHAFTEIRTMEDVANSESQKCPPKNNVKIVHGHGNIIPKEVFRIPTGVKVITLSQTDVCILSPQSLEDINNVFIPFMKLYMDGNTIFENNDSVKKLDSNFEPLIDYYKSLGAQIATTGVIPSKRAQSERSRL